MPTPFYHLITAEVLLQNPALSSEVLRRLEGHRFAFLFGTTAPDVQTVAGHDLDRRATHFFGLPLRPGVPYAWEQMLGLHPSLRDAAALPAEQAAFIAGYLCHLQADWLWVEEIFAPVFGSQNTWHTFPRRLYLHNVLRAYLDRQIFPALAPDLGAGLAQVSPSGWLRFVEDGHLRRWRDLLVQQLMPGAASQTVEVFAARQGISPDAYRRLIGSEERMEREVFARVPRRALDDFRERLLDENARLLHAYLTMPAEKSFLDVEG